MSQNFASYTEVSTHALSFNPKSQEVIDKKQEILQSISEHAKSAPESILFYGFNPLILATKCRQIAVTEITDEIKKYLDSTGVKYVYIKESNLYQYKKQFDWVVAADEYFTFASTETEQRDKIEIAVGIAKDLILTTLRDYKNQDFRDREFSQPLAVRKGSNSRVFLEHHDYDYSDKNVWKTVVYDLYGSSATMSGPYDRRSMFFKQMAKFSLDAGAKEFYVHKNLMYKSLIKKNYEHVISISL
jgi:hypothetical protein